ncbi:MAG: 50S ribosomal protein L3 [Candidatus Paceibacterota bacterium]
MKFILGKKVKMSQIFEEEGKVIPVTIIEAGPVIVTKILTKEKNGYEAIQVGFEEKKKNIKKPLLGQFKKLKEKIGNKVFRFLKEFRLDKGKKEEGVSYELGQEIKVDIFSPGDKVTVSGISRGKGFQGVVKRHHFKGSPKSHGTKDRWRAPGSIGATTPQRVVKGRKMAGRTGGERITIKNLEVVKVDPEKNLLYLKGAVPGKKGTLLEIKT